MAEPLRRIFAAVPLPTEVRLYLADRFSVVDIPGKVVPPENWHLTLRFLGHIDEVTYERFLGSLGAKDLGSSFKVSMGGLGAFPRPGRATVFWLGIQDGVDQLRGLATRSEEAAQDAGLPAEERPFRPHLTLSRIRPPEDVRRLIAAIDTIEIGWRCESVVVYQSHLGRGGAHYEPLETVALGR